MIKRLFDASFIYEWSDEEIIGKICERIRQLRRSCCLSQEEFAGKTGVSVATVKRIENRTVRDISLMTILKIGRATGVLEGVADLVPDLPDSPFLTARKSGKRYCKEKFKDIRSS